MKIEGKKEGVTYSIENLAHKSLYHKGHVRIMYRHKEYFAENASVYFYPPVKNVGKSNESFEWVEWYRLNDIWYTY